MKKSLLALAVLGAFAGVASAQSSVTLYGIVDLNGRYVKDDGSDRRLSLSHGRHQQQPARLPRHRGSRRRPEGRLQLDGRHQRRHRRRRHAKFWNRRSTVSLFGNFGEVRLGRDYTPTFWNLTIFDAFGTNGLGSLAERRASSYGGTSRQTTRSATSCREPGRLLRPGRWSALRRRHARRPRRLATSAAASASPRARSTSPCALRQQRSHRATPIGRPAGVDRRAGATQKTFNVGGSWDFGFVKLMGYYDRDKLRRLSRRRSCSISGVVPFGQAKCASATTAARRHSTPASRLGNESSRSRRRYAVQPVQADGAVQHASRASTNKDDATRSRLPGAAGGPTPGGESKGFELGVRHFF